MKETKDIRLHEGRNRMLGYVPEFKLVVREHPDILRTALELTQKGEDEYNPPNIMVGSGELQWNKEQTRFDVIKINGEDLATPQPYEDWLYPTRGVLLAKGETFKDENTGLEVTILGRSKRDHLIGMFGHTRRIDNSSYFKIKLGEQAFFIKKSTATINPGFEEFDNTHQAMAALSGMDNLRIVEAQLGYADDHQSWFVSKWEDLENVGFYPCDAFIGGSPTDYGEFIDIEDKRWQAYGKNAHIVSATVSEIRTKLKSVGLNIQDIEPNLFYNPMTEKYFLLDVTVRGRKQLGQLYKPHKPPFK